LLELYPFSGKIHSGTIHSDTTSEPQKLLIAFGNKKHAEIIADGVKKLRKSGRLQEILKKYNLVDWEINVINR